MPQLTPRESRLLEVIGEHLERTGFPPTRAELRTAMGWKSLSTVQHYLNRLRKKGSIHFVRGAARSIRLLAPVRAADRIPIVGRIAAGSPLLSDENIENTVPADAVVPLFRTRPDFFLRVQGESMSGAGIRDGDLVAVRKAADARNGDIVVACMDGEATLKRLLRNNGHLALVPEHPDHEPIPISGERFEIRGIVVGSLHDRCPS